MPLNITEGAGEYSKSEKERFYRMARRSATECTAIFDVQSPFKDFVIFLKRCPRYFLISGDVGRWGAPNKAVIFLPRLLIKFYARITIKNNYIMCFL